MQNPAWRDVLTGEAIEAGPVEPVPLTSSQEGMPPRAADLATETIQSQQVRRNCMVCEVTIQDPLKPPVVRKNSVRHHAASFSKPYSWCSPPRIAFETTR